MEFKNFRMIFSFYSNKSDIKRDGLGEECEFFLNARLNTKIAPFTYQDIQETKGLSYSSSLSCFIIRYISITKMLREREMRLQTD